MQPLARPLRCVCSWRTWRWWCAWGITWVFFCTWVFLLGVQLHSALLHGSCWMGFGVFSPEHCSCQTLYWYSVGVFVFRLTCWIASIGLLHVFLSLLLGQTHCSSQFHIAHWCFGAATPAGPFELAEIAAEEADLDCQCYSDGEQSQITTGCCCSMCWSAVFQSCDCSSHAAMPLLRWRSATSTFDFVCITSCPALQLHQWELTIKGKIHFQWSPSPAPAAGHGRAAPAWC